MKTPYLDKILNDIEPTYVPLDLIAAASVRTSDGKRHLFTAEEYEEFIYESSDDILDVKLLINMDKAKEIILAVSESILKNIAK